MYFFHWKCIIDPFPNSNWFFIETVTVITFSDSCSAVTSFGEPDLRRADASPVRRPVLLQGPTRLHRPGRGIQAEGALRREARTLRRWFFGQCELTTFKGQSYVWHRYSYGTMQCTYWWKFLKQLETQNFFRNNLVVCQINVVNRFSTITNDVLNDR